MDITDPEWLKEHALRLDLDQRVRVSFAWRNEEGRVLFKEIPVGERGRVFLTWAFVAPMGDFKTDLLSGTYQVVTFPFGNFGEIRALHREWPFERHDITLRCTDSHYQCMSSSPCKESVVVKILAKGSNLKPEHQHLAVVPFGLPTEAGTPTDDLVNPWDRCRALKKPLTPIHEVTKKPWWPLYKQIVTNGAAPSEDLVPPEPILGLDGLMYALRGDDEYPGLTRLSPTLHTTRRWEDEWFFMEGGFGYNAGWTTASVERVHEWAQGLPEPENEPRPTQPEPTIDQLVTDLLED